MKKKASVFHTLWVLLVIFSLTGANLVQAYNPATEASHATTLPGDLTSQSWQQILAVMEYYYEQQAYVKASNTQASDEFGYSVAVSGNTVVVGARKEDSNATGVGGDQENDDAEDSGAAYVFVRGSSGAWSQQAYLKASNTSAGDYFGTSVAISGDTIVVGAPYESGADDTRLGSGAAYVYVRNGDAWSFQAYLEASNADLYDHFGSGVGISGDVIVVGALDEDSGATGVGGNQADNMSGSAGAAYIFTRSGGTWSQQAYLKASNTGEGDKFGSSVAISGNTVVIGAPEEDGSATGVGGADNNGATNSGAAYIYVYDGGWSAPLYTKASNTESQDRFGSSVAISENTVVVGAIEEDSNAIEVNGEQNNNGASNAGAAYVFFRSGVSWGQQAYLKASNTDASDYFGISVAVSGDAVVVGAYREASNATGIDGNQANNSAASSGAAYTYIRNSTNWSFDAYVKASNTGGGDRFGIATAMSDNLMIIGANGEGSNATGIDGNQANNSAASSGAAYALLFGEGPDLGLVKSVSPDNVAPGEALTYTLTFSNAGGLPATQVVLTDIIPTGIVPNGWVASPGLALTQTLGNEYVWQVQNLDGNHGGVITITAAAAIPLAAGIITNVASISGVGSVATSLAPITVRQAPPVANAGSDQTIKPGAHGTLHGSGSDPNGDALAYVWNQTGGPNVTLNNSAIAEPTFTAPMSSTVLTFTLTVGDGIAGQEDTDEVVVTVANQIPVADAGPDQIVGPGATVALDGSNSSDGDGDPLLFAWVQSGGPGISINNATTSHPSFSAPPVASAVITITLTVDDNYGGTDDDEVVITVTNRPPVADAGPDRAAHPGNTVTLDGRNSVDPDGGPISYQWTQTGGTPVTLNPNAQDDLVTFTAPPSTEVLTFTLTVTDSFDVASEPDEVIVTIGNVAPVANAGPDQSVGPGAMVTLDGSGSSDPEGDVLTYTWAQAGGDPVTLTNSDQMTATFTAPSVEFGVLTFTLTVDDGYGLQASDDVVITITNQPPVADAGPDQTVSPGATVTLNGGGSSDPESDVLTYTWAQTGGTLVTLSSSDQVTATFTAPMTVPTVLTFTLTVGDGEFTDSDEVTITVERFLVYLPLILK